MFLSIGMLKQKYFLADIFILSAEKQPIKLSWRKIECLLISSIQHTDHGINDYHYLRRSFTLTESIQPFTKKEKPLEIYVSNSFSNFINSGSSNQCVLQTILYYYFSMLLSCLDD